MTPEANIGINVNANILLEKFKTRDLPTISALRKQRNYDAVAQLIRQSAQALLELGLFPSMDVVTRKSGAKIKGSLYLLYLQEMNCLSRRDDVYHDNVYVLDSGGNFYNVLFWEDAEAGVLNWSSRRKLKPHKGAEMILSYMIRHLESKSSRTG